MAFKTLCTNLNEYFTSLLMDDTRKDMRLYEIRPKKRLWNDCLDVTLSGWYGDYRFGPFISATFQFCDSCRNFIIQYGDLLLKNDDGTLISPLWSLPKERIPLEYQKLFEILNTKFQKRCVNSTTLQMIDLKQRYFLGNLQDYYNRHLAVQIPKEWYTRCSNLSNIARFWNMLTSKDGCCFFFDARRTTIRFDVRCYTCFAEEKCTHVESAFYCNQKLYKYDLIDMLQIKSLADLFPPKAASYLSAKLHRRLINVKERTFSQDELWEARNKQKESGSKFRSLFMYCITLECARYAMPQSDVCFYCYKKGIGQDKCYRGYELYTSFKIE